MPSFKAGIHGGPVVTAEVGDLKRDVVHSGDTVNAAARIEAQCRPLGKTLLVSERVVDWLPPSSELRVDDMGAMPLRGKTERLRLFSISRLAAPAGR